MLIWVDLLVAQWNWKSKALKPLPEALSTSGWSGQVVPFLGSTFKVLAGLGGIKLTT